MKQYPLNLHLEHLVFSCQCIFVGVAYVHVAANDFIMEMVELQFAPNQTEISFSIHTLSDFLLEADEEFVVRIEVTDSSKMIGVKHSKSNTSSATVTIINTNGNICICMYTKLYILFV